MYNKQTKAKLRRLRRRLAKALGQSQQTVKLKQGFANGVMCGPGCVSLNGLVRKEYLNA